MEKEEIIPTFIISDARDGGFTQAIYEARDFISKANVAVLHDFKTFYHYVFKPADNDFQFRILIHVGWGDQGLSTKIGDKILEDFRGKPEFKTVDISFITRNPDLFGEEFYVERDKKRYWNANRINREDAYEQFLKTNLPLNKEDLINDRNNETIERTKTEVVQQNVTSHIVSSSSVDIAIITALYYDEMEKIKEVFEKESNLQRISVGQHSGYKFSFNKKNIIAVSQAEMGMVDAAILTTKIINDYKPKHIIMPGVCGGDKKTSLGDIIISKKIKLLFSGKMTDSEIEPDSVQEDADTKLIENIKPEITKTTNDLIGGIIPEIKSVLTSSRTYKAEYSKYIEKELKHHIEPTACSLLVIDKKDYFDEFVKKFDRKMIAVEMEGYGLARAVKLSGANTKALLVKCVMDNADGTKSDEGKEFAALVSALFVKKLIEKDLLI